MVGSTNVINLLNKEIKMTSQLTLRSLDIPSIHKFAVGFDNMFEELMRTSQHVNTNYPPYNVIKLGEDKFAIQLAVAGFKNGDIDVQVERNQLTITGEQSIDLNHTVEYLHRGISARSFTRTWTLADHVEVKGAEVADGILTVNLERIVPEEQKPKKIAINFNK
jgi:molecular chaperone IbpA